jgi:hypothetical protein
MGTRLRQLSHSSVLRGLRGCLLAAALGGGMALSPLRLAGQAVHPAASRRR